jgi:hypothetical protein
MSQAPCHDSKASAACCQTYTYDGDVARSVLYALKRLQLASPAGVAAAFTAAEIHQALCGTAALRTLEQTTASLACMVALKVIRVDAAAAAAAAAAAGAKYSPNLDAPREAPSLWRQWFLVQILPWANVSTGRDPDPRYVPACRVAPELPNKTMPVTQACCLARNYPPPDCSCFV